jgi:histidine triad (HIT) family protein
MVQCFTCDVNEGHIPTAGGVIYEDRSWLAEHGVDRLVRGYVVLKPRRHVHEFADLEPDEAVSLGPAMQTVLRAMRLALKTERIYVCSFAETVQHLHFHLIPRYAHMPRLGPTMIPDLFAAHWGCSQEEAEGAAHEIRAAILYRPTGTPAR